MYDFFQWLLGAFSSIGNVLDNFSFSIAGINVSILEIMLGFLAMSMIITIFWKGARG